MQFIGTRMINGHDATANEAEQEEESYTDCHTVDRQS